MPIMKRTDEHRETEVTATTYPANHPSDASSLAHNSQVRTRKAALTCLMAGYLYTPDLAVHWLGKLFYGAFKCIEAP